VSASEEIAALLAAASESPDRGVRAVYAAEARIRLARERDRLIELSLLVDAVETDLARAAR
jgi:hypothetical protein